MARNKRRIIILSLVILAFIVMGCAGWGDWDGLDRNWSVTATAEAFDPLRPPWTPMP